MPSRRTVANWAKADPEFAAALAEARRVQAGALADELLKRAVDLDRRGRRGKLQRGEAQAYRERAITTRWLLERMDSSTFGTKAPGQQTAVVIQTTLDFGGKSSADEAAEYIITVPSAIRPKQG